MNHRAVAVAVAAILAAGVAAADTDAVRITLAGPTMGTIWRVSLGGPVAGMTAGDVHREIEAVLDRIDRAASTWRDDSDVSRFHRAAAGEWLEIAPDLAAIVATARRVHEQSAGGFDITVGPLVRLWRGGQAPAAGDVASALDRVGMRFVEVRLAEGDRPAAIRKTVAGVELDLDGIAPGYAVDRIGERLAALGSTAHLVELGGEVRAWGARADGSPWRVAMRPTDGPTRHPRLVELAAGEALATSTLRPGGGAIDPRSGRRVERHVRSATVKAASCAEADAWAVAALVLDLPRDDHGFVRDVRAQGPATASPPPAPSTTAAPPAATPAAP